MSEIDLKELYDSLPDNDELLDFDAFLIGDGSRQLMQQMDKPRRRRFQLTGIEKPEDLVKGPQESFAQFPIEDDLAQYAVEPKEFEGSFIDYFYNTKKAIFDGFDYISKKSESMQGLPFREKDLVLTKEDKYTITYLESKGLTDLSIVDSLAQLKAYLELGFIEVKFSQSDCCPLCEAYDGIVYTLDFLVSIFGSGACLIHENCFGKFIPVIRTRDEYYGPLEMTVEEAFVGDILIKNLPIEFSDDLLDISTFLEYEEVHFVDLTDFSDYSDEVVRDCGTILYVSNAYCGDNSPFDFIKIWLDSKESSDRSSEVSFKIEEDDVYFLNGRKVVELDGLYFDIETKEQIK